MKKIALWKRVVLLLLLAAAAVRIGYVWIGGEVYRPYYISAQVDLSTASPLPCQAVRQQFSSRQDRLNYLELLFDGIPEDRTGHLVLQVLSQEEVLYQTNISLANVENMVWKLVYLNFELDGERVYDICLSASEDCTQIPNVLLLPAGAPESGTVLANGTPVEGALAIQYGYLATPALASQLTATLKAAAALFAAALCILFAEQLLRVLRRMLDLASARIPRTVILAALEVLACLFLFRFSRVPFLKLTMLILLAVSVLSVRNLEEKCRFVYGLCETTFQRVLLYLLYVYAAFALVGHRLLVYPLDQKTSLRSLVVFAVAVLWFIPLVQSGLYLYHRLVQRFPSRQRRAGNVLFTVLVVLALLLPALINLYPNNPGISSYDTYISMIDNAHHLHGMYNWHPAFYCMVLRLLLNIWDSTYMVILAQYFFWAYVVTELLLYLRKKQINDWVLYGAALFCGINPGNFLHLNTIWKDIPYTISVLWVLILLAKLSIDFEEYKKKWYIYLELTVALVGIFFYRKNGMVTCLVVMAAAAVLLRKNVKLWGALAVTAALIFTIKGPVYDYFEVQDPGREGMYIGLSQDILGVYYAGGQVSEDTLKMINVMTYYNVAEYEEKYNPTYAWQSYDLKVEPSEFIRCYLDTFFKNPVLTVRAVLAREEPLWDIFTGENPGPAAVNYHSTIDGMGEWNDYYPARTDTFLTQFMTLAVGYTAYSQRISAVAWRSGLHVLAGLTVCLYLISRCGWKKHLLILAPIAGHIFSLLLTTGWSDFRYYWPLNLMCLALFLLTPVIAAREGKPVKQKGAQPL